MEANLKSLQKQLDQWYASNNLLVRAVYPNPEKNDYLACEYIVKGLKVICRTSKITPKKLGQFVAVWKRNSEGITIPYYELDDFDLMVIFSNNHSRSGQFVFPKKVLVQHGIISTETKEGKRGFRLYPAWDKPISKQAIKTQEWQLEYFVEAAVDGNINLDTVKNLYSY